MNAYACERSYQIRVRGLLDPSVLAAFPELEARFDRGCTELLGRLPDQSALHGVLAKMESFGLELIGLRRKD